MKHVEHKPIRRLREADYFFEDRVEMHYAYLQVAEKIGPVLHTHEFFEILLLVKGKIRHLINGHSLVLTDGSLTFIRPEDAHAFRPVKGDGCHMINLAVTRDVIQALFAYLGDGFPKDEILAQPMPPTTRLNGAAKLQMVEKFEALNRLPHDHPDQKRTALRIFLFELVTHYFRLGQLPQFSNYPLWLRKVCEEMHRPENFALGVTRMLDLSAVTAEHLARTMRKHTGQTPTDYINQIRLNYVANRLIHGDQPIGDAAAEAGFYNLSYFYKRFRERYGQTPRAYRLEHRSELLT